MKKVTEQTLFEETLAAIERLVKDTPNDGKDFEAKISALCQVLYALRDCDAIH